MADNKTVGEKKGMAFVHILLLATKEKAKIM